jgi:YidC/Oxa1 family membrane protein insertase
MQEIQPEVKSIQDRYAKYKTTDPARQKMNQELMALYKERGVNPASGCVPMLLTMPVLIAFYALLSTAIELRGAPFVGWIHDLSLHDPFYVTPVLMGGTMVWQQKLAPATGVDPTQQKMMMLMPVVFTFMFLWAPAGVAVYWLMSNLWGIGQQYLTNYLIGPPAVRTIRPAAERQVKRVPTAAKTEAAAREN